MGTVGCVICDVMWERLGIQRKEAFVNGFALGILVVDTDLLVDSKRICEEHRTEVVKLLEELRPLLFRKKTS
jgi:hypothetical protein